MSPTTKTAPRLLTVRAKTYLALKDAPRRIKPRLAITLSRHAYLPRIDDLASDWVAHVAAPAFRLYRTRRGHSAVPSFCSIGTGSGLDVLAASELLGARRVGLTDVHEEVVRIAADNVARNHQSGKPLVIESGFGDLLAPLRSYRSRYAVIYENLPNVPLADGADLGTARISSTHVPPRRERLPALVRQQMLDLHFLALRQARDFLEPGGVVLSTLGARVPLKAFLELGRLAGFTSTFLTYTWKVQADPLIVVRDHARKQQEGFGPFHFYPAETLAKAFASVEVERSGARALEIEQSLAGARLDATAAHAALLRGTRIGHTVAVLQSEVRPS